MTDVRKIKTASLYEHRYSYSRAVAAGDWIFVSNTAGRNYETRAIAPDAAGQTEQVFRNIEAALGRLGASLADVVRVRIFVPDPQDVDAVLAIVGERFRGIDPANTTTCTPLAQPELKVELEVTAYRPGAGRG
jgi:enamine deaminase RidA (YjgF/YER057c/UK114 family)